MGSYVTERCTAIQALTALGSGKGPTTDAGVALALMRCLGDAAVPVRLEALQAGHCHLPEPCHDHAISSSSIVRLPNM